MIVPLKLHSLLQVKGVQSNMVMRFILFNFLILAAALNACQGQNDM